MSNTFKCENCGTKGTELDFPPAQDLEQRLDYNGPYTDKECPDCGSLAYLVETPKPKFSSGDKVKDAADRLTAAKLACAAANDEHTDAVLEFLKIVRGLSRTETTLAMSKAPKSKKKKPKCKTPR